MRMWQVNPKIMCRNHLLGEHVELHMFKSSIEKGINMDGYIKSNLLEPLSIINRHEKLVSEMDRRGYNHSSTIGYLRLYQLFDIKDYRYKIDKKKSLKELLRRCKECRKLFRRQK